MCRLMVVALLVLPVFLTSSVHSAKLLVATSPGTVWAEVTIYGEIKPADAADFRAKVADLTKAGKLISVVYLQSPGGDVDAAIDIGRQIRLLRSSTQAPTIVGNVPGKAWCNSFAVTPNGASWYNRYDGSGDPNCTCASACFLIWSGGIVRRGGVLGVHRPRYDTEYFRGLSPAQATAKYNQLVAKVSQYLTEVGMPDYIIRLQYSASSAGIRYLSLGEIEPLSETNLGMQEYLIAKCGPRWTTSPSAAPCVEQVLRQYRAEGLQEYHLHYPIQ